MGVTKKQNTQKKTRIWQTEPSLVAFYDVRSGNRLNLFFDAQSQRATTTTNDDNKQNQLQQQQQQQHAFSTDTQQNTLPTFKC